MKYGNLGLPSIGGDVAPFVGAWIEIIDCPALMRFCTVAPFVGAWIEILVIVALDTLRYRRSVRRSVD